MITAKQIEAALAIKFPDADGWALLREVTLADPEADPEIDEYATGAVPTYRRIDALLFRTYHSSRAKVQYERIAVEIKTSRADFFRDTELKRRVWKGATHRFVYCTPAGLVKPEEVPEGCGLLEVHSLTLVKWKVRAPYQESPVQFDDHFMAYIAGRASRAEARVRQLDKKYPRIGYFEV